MTSKYKDIMKQGLFEQNPVFMQALGMCPALATTTSAINAIGMGVATTCVLVMSNIVISLIKKLIPDKIRIPAYIVVIASFVTMIDMLMHGFTYELWKTLGLFIPLIVVNCLILGRAESFASRNSTVPAFLDGLFMGLGFTGALFILGSVREILGNGSFMGMQFSEVKLFAFVLPPGAYLALGILAGLFTFVSNKFSNKTKEKS